MNEIAQHLAVMDQAVAEMFDRLKPYFNALTPEESEARLRKAASALAELGDVYPLLMLHYGILAHGINFLERVQES